MKLYRAMGMRSGLLMPPMRGHDLKRKLGSFAELDDGCPPCGGTT